MRTNQLKTKYLIIGAGLAGLSSAYHLNDDYLLIEASDSVGGMAGTLRYKNYKLDNAVHILYFKKKHIKDWITNHLEIELLEKQRNNAIWINNNFIRFPLQYHLYDLTLLSRSRAFSSICKTLKLKKKNQKYKNFENYSLDVFGNYLTKIFVQPYNEKLFGVPLSQMNIDWMGDYVPEYSKIKMLLSAAGLVDRNYGRNSNYFYPSEGGISIIAEGILSNLKIPPVYNCSLVDISLNNKTATFSDGTKINFKYLINTIPLNIFLQKVENLSLNISESTGLLRNTSTTLLHLLCKGTLLNKYDWIYVSDREIPFYRITLPGNINSKNCPTNQFSITLEFGGNVYNNEKVLKSSLKALNEMGILDKNNLDIDYYWKLINCGYIIYDEKRADVLEKILPFLESNEIYSIGRYGIWEYSNMEDAILHGERIAKKLLSYD